MKRTKKNRQAGCLQTGKSERTAARAAKCVTDYDQENTGIDFRKDKGRDKPLSTFLQASEIKTRQCIYRPALTPEMILGLISCSNKACMAPKWAKPLMKPPLKA